MTSKPKKVNLNSIFVVVIECKAKWNYLLSAYISCMKADSDKKIKNPYSYITQAMVFMLPLIKTSGTPIENLSNFHQQPALGTTQYHPGSTQNALNLVKKKYDFQPVRQATVDSLVTISPVQLLVTSVRKQDTDVSHGKISNYVPNLHSNPIKGISQKRTYSDIDGSFAENGNMNNKKTTVTSSECNEKRKLFLLSLLPKIECMTDSQMNFFERGVGQIINNIINPRSYLQLSLPSTYTPTSSLTSSSHSSPFIVQYPSSWPTNYQMPVGQQRHDHVQEPRTFSAQGILSQSLGTYSPQVTFSQSLGTYSPQNVFPQIFGTLSPQIMNCIYPTVKHFHTDTS